MTERGFMKKKKFSKSIVVFSVVFIVIYTIASLIVQYFTTMSPSDSLTYCVYTFFGIEMLAMAGIKVSDAKYENKSLGENLDNDSDDFYTMTYTYPDDYSEEYLNEDIEDIEEDIVDFEQLTFDDIEDVDTIDNDMGPGKMT